MPRTHKEIEEGVKFTLDWNKMSKVVACGQPLVPVAVQDVSTKEVLLLAYVNKFALDHTLATGNATFWSTSRNELWEKGATSGDFLKIVEIRVNCEQNSLLYLVRPTGQGACHTKGSDGTVRRGCYYRKLVHGALEMCAHA